MLHRSSVRLPRTNLVRSHCVLRRIGSTFSCFEMGKYQVMKPVKEVDVSAVKYKSEDVKVPHLTVFLFKLFVKMFEAPLIGTSIVNSLKNNNGMTEWQLACFDLSKFVQYHHQGESL